MPVWVAVSGFVCLSSSVSMGYRVSLTLHVEGVDARDSRTACLHLQTRVAAFWQTHYFEAVGLKL